MALIEEIDDQQKKKIATKVEKCLGPCNGFADWLQTLACLRFFSSGDSGIACMLKEEEEDSLIPS